MPASAIPGTLVSGGPAAVAERIGEFRDIGAKRVVVTLVAGDWFRQADLLAEATALS
jgi:alkanesulfonate monooxygenase SsuD/methylene tetrahydromethanopterin reductase-like flavin-dependent oxidoreductase (luciferase family)